MALDFLAGCLGGSAGVLVGHPFDTVKVHLQTQDPRNPKYLGIVHCFRTIWAEEKVKGLYRGMSSPLAGLSFVNAIVFGIYAAVQRRCEDPNALSTHCLAGGVAGYFQSIVCAPMELTKTIVQVQNDRKGGIKFNSTFECFKYILRTKGWRGGLKGLGITAARDVPGFSSYFTTYEYLISLSPQPGTLHTLFAGGAAGVASWLSCYPIDVVKTCIQADSAGGENKYKGAIDCAIKGYRSDGLHFFVRGINSTILRAIPMNAACFFVVSLVKQFDKEDADKEKYNFEEDNEPRNVKPYNVDRLRKQNKISHEYSKNNLKKIKKTRQTMKNRLNATIALSDDAVFESDIELLTYELYPNEIDDNHYNYEYERHTTFDW